LSECNRDITPKAWARLCEVSVDRDKLASTYEEFLSGAERKVQANEAAGASVLMFGTKQMNNNGPSTRSS
jgi:hypothetical protein